MDENVCGTEARSEYSGSGFACTVALLGPRVHDVYRARSPLHDRRSQGSPADQEFYELRLYDSDSAGLPVYCVREARTRWDNEVRDMVRDKEQERTFVRQQEAEEWYEARRRALAKEGFIYSDMDLSIT